MKNILLTTALAFSFSTAAIASGTHGGGHDEEPVAMQGHSDDGHGHDEEMAIGMPADDHHARIVKVSMKETDDGDMIFEPSVLSFKSGETIRIKITNDGEQVHEFVMDTVEANVEHKAMMERFPEMEHDDPNAVRLESGASGEIVWTFSNAGTFEFACLIPGHYESGMHGPLVVN